MKIRNPSHQTTRGYRPEGKCPWLFLLCFKKAKTIKTGSKFIIRDTVWHMGEHTEKQFQSEARQKHTAREDRGRPETRSAVKRAFKSLIGQSFWGFTYLWQIILFLFSHLVLGPPLPPNTCAQVFAKMDPTAEAHGCMSALIMGVVPSSLFDLQEAFLRRCRQGSFPWHQKWAPYLFTLAELSFCH